MGLTGFILLLSVFIFHSTSSWALTLSELGERSENCENLENDDFIFDVSPILSTEVQNLFENDKLDQLIAPYPNCFRVGSEIRLQVPDKEISYLGRAFVSSIQNMTRGQLLKKQSHYNSSTINEYLAAQPETQFSVLSIKVSEKIQQAFVNENFKRLPNCFSSFDDWQSISFTNTAENVKEIKKIQSGQLTAMAWNGTLNCYKIGTRTKITIQGERPFDHGSLLPKELYLVHFSDLSEKHASLLGEKLDDLKTRLREKIKTDGGYISLVVFEYLPPRPEQPQQEPILE